MTIVLMLIAAGIGAVLRSLLGKTISERTKSFPIPLGMAAVNLLGSFGLGMFTGLGLDNPSAGIIIATGFFGAFTTFSTFSIEAVQLMMNNRIKESLLYIAVSAAGSLLAFWCGFIIISI
ncbi:fluoride efflux transporter CrcB [Bacillus amyloliquefaciens]|jgi:CrcB protein|uniref:fluoride efflux transporter CrcB n=1 Tax=Bacillus amyloliquefaciens TaxID=1390 RepID=UPI001580294A|nr:fluoride efflux transporter CrcB [Bacillus amyloliquefaciens]NUI23780.1 fluoride efflux transporter CrcB [Bacillus amyloliquefaciens]NUI32767.1 fluoride efflux transporter CrcB [Bacillus amyloliquefaciens]NUI36473.1 fluoride efflux transporter CrcB [Bacillus amyloliquefaciens]NUI70141.1 fluoride efflux transporter CrcB [Bacillus amyloliquefaciens]NUI73738.1 fluoride efflux transporter CrcB [Bacillus amyloliquefaciens]